MIDINSYNDSRWAVSKFRLEVSISGSGSVGSGVTVGAAVRLAFEWDKVKGSRFVGTPNEAYTEKRENLRRVLASVAKDMETVSSEIYKPSKFDLVTLRVGIGMYLNVDFGVVKGSIGVMGYAFFSKSDDHFANSTSAKKAIVLDDEIPLIDTAPQKHHIAYAKQKNIRYTASSNPAGGQKVIYFMARNRFQKGLNKAAHIGAFFAERAHRMTGDTRQRKWAIDEIRAQFALSLEGAVPVVTIGGTVALQLIFKRPIN